MTTTMHSYSEADRQRVIDFRRLCNTAENSNDYPTVLDLHELLHISLAGQTVRTALWEDSSGKLVAYAIVDSQYCNCYFLVSPHFRSHELETGILNWAQDRLRDGTLAAFCYSTIPTETNQLSGRNEGEVAIIGTRSAYRAQGLGRAMLLTALQRLKDRGVETAVLGTSSENAAAQAISASAGFHIRYRSLWYSRPISR